MVELREGQVFPATSWLVSIERISATPEKSSSQPARPSTSIKHVSAAWPTRAVCRRENCFH